MTVLKTAIATYPHTKGLKDGTVSVPGVAVRACRGLADHRRFPPHVPHVRLRRLRDGDYDVPDCQGSRQKVHGAARVRHAPVPPLPDRL